MSAEGGAGRAPVLAGNLVATAQPLATQAGVAALARGGNAVDAALAAALTLTVVAPTGCGLGSDLFALVDDGRMVHGLKAAGRAPAAWTPARFAGRAAMPELGWDSVTVPGAAGGWQALAERFAVFPLVRLAEPAVAYARRGFPVSPGIAGEWASGAQARRDQPGFAATFCPEGRPPAAGEIVRLPAIADSLEEIAQSGGEALYRGRLAEALADHSRRHGGGLAADDLAAYTPRWVTPLSVDVAGWRVYGLPPPSQAVAGLLALGLIDPDRQARGGAAAGHEQIEAMKLAQAAVAAELADPEAMARPAQAFLGEAERAQLRAGLDPQTVRAPQAPAPTGAGTVAVTAADSTGLTVSLMQSNYRGFGSGVVPDGTGISLHNRGASFGLAPGHPNRVGPSKLPAHTLMPGLLKDRSTGAATALGVMGGPVQPQGFLQVALRLMVQGQDPQAAIAAPRWRLLGGRSVALEDGLSAQAGQDLAACGHSLEPASAAVPFGFGGAQAVQGLGRAAAGGSDGRQDGQAAGI